MCRPEWMQLVAKPRNRQLHQSGAASTGASAQPQSGAGLSAGSQRWLVELAARMDAVVTLTPVAPPVGSSEAIDTKSNSSNYDC